MAAETWWTRGWLSRKREMGAHFTLSITKKDGCYLRHARSSTLLPPEENAGRERYTLRCAITEREHYSSRRASPQSGLSRDDECAGQGSQMSVARSQRAHQCAI